MSERNQQNEWLTMSECTKRTRDTATAFFYEMCVDGKRRAVITFKCINLASVLKHTHTSIPYQFVDDDNDDENVSTVKTTLFCRSHSQWL